MKKIFKSIALASLGLAILFSCTKNEPVVGTADGNGQMKLSVTGVLGEYKAAEGTKASLVNTPRVGWSGNETVHVFQQSDGKYLGSLTSSVKATGASVAKLGGTISSGTGTLVFVYTNATMPSLTADDKYTNLEISLAEQGTDIPFVVYGTAESPGTGTVSGLVVNFSFATSVVSTYAAGLPANTAVTQATLDNINTNCVLTIPESGDITVSGSTSGIITKTSGIGSTNAEGQVLFEIAVPVSDAASSGRSVEFTIDSETYTTAFSGEAIVAGKAYSAMSENHSVEGVALNKTSTTISQGAAETLIATVYPLKSNQELTWTSSDEAIATVDNDGKVTGVALGTATITATSKDDSSISATCTVTVKEREYVIIGDKKWATKNLGATTIAGSLATCAGDYYQWGSVNTLYEHVTWSGSSGTFSFKDGKESGFVSGYREYTDNDAHLPDLSDVVKQNVGNGWRMPKKEDFVALYNACGGTGTTGSLTALSSATPGKGIYWLPKTQTYISDYTGVAGLLFVDKNQNMLFFPAAGFGAGTSLTDAGSYGYYWSSSLVTSYTNYAYILRFFSDYVYPENKNDRYFGYSVRPVSDL